MDMLVLDDTQDGHKQEKILDTDSHYRTIIPAASSTIRSSLEVYHTIGNTVSKTGPAFDPIVSLEDIFCLVPWLDLGQILPFVDWGIGNPLVIRANLTKDRNHIRPIDRFCKCEDSLVFNR